MGKRDILDLTTEAELECEHVSMGDLCPCTVCDLSRRARVAAFAQRWMETNEGAERSGVRSTRTAETVRPPRLAARPKRAS